MKKNLSTAFKLLVVSVLLEPAAGAQELTLEATLEKIEGRSQTLRSMQSRIHQKKWTDILEEFDEGESGKFEFLREDEKVYLRRDILDPEKNTLVIRDGIISFYQPRIKQLQQYDLGQRSDRAEFLLLGFGSSSKKLRDTYQVRLGEKRNLDGREAYQLFLKPRSDRVSAIFSEIVLWIDTTLWVPIQQKLVEPTADYMLIRFEDIVLNPDIPLSRFKVRVPRDAKVVRN